MADYTEQGYYHINRKLRENEQLTEDEQEYIKQITEGLNRMKSWQGIVQRFSKVNVDKIDQFKKVYVKGNIVQSPQFLSTSHEMDTSSKIFKQFRNVDEDTEMGYRMVIRSKNGVPIQSISKYRNQRQVLFKIGAKFKIIDVITYDWNMVIYMEEI